VEGGGVGVGVWVKMVHTGFLRPYFHLKLKLGLLLNKKIKLTRQNYVLINDFEIILKPKYLRYITNAIGLCSAELVPLIYLSFAVYSKLIIQAKNLSLAPYFSASNVCKHKFNFPPILKCTQNTFQFSTMSEILQLLVLHR